MKRSRENWLKITNIIISFLLFISISTTVFANKISFEIKGNDFTDEDVILSLLRNIPNNIDEEYSNEIIKVLNDSNLFSEVLVKYEENKYIIFVKEFPSIDKIYFDKNERLKDEDLQLIASEINLSTFNTNSLNLYVNELITLYESFGYNDVKIEYTEKFYEDINTVDIYFKINEGKITKIKNIFIEGNNTILSQEIKDTINSKTKSLKNIFANNNYKPAVVERDKFLISNFYKNNGFINVNVETKIEFLETNQVNIYFLIEEGDIFLISNINVKDENNVLNVNTSKIVNNEIENFLLENNVFSSEKIKELKKQISELVIESGVEFFEIITTDNVENKNINILFQISPIIPKYTKQINIVGNSRTLDYVIRRELSIVEGDAIHKSQIESIRDKLISLNLFKSVNIQEELVDEDQVNLIIDVEEKQTGTFNAGVSVGTLDGFAIVTGLRERNFYGTGRSLDVLVNTSDDNNQFKLITTDRLSYENDANISYSINYRQQDFSNASSYKLDTFTSGIGIGYKINKNIFHNIDFEYALKDYKITNSSTVSDSILTSSGGNMSYLIKNNIRYSSLNRGFISRKGSLLNFNNTIETPTSSRNGFVRNIITIKQFNTFNKNIFSMQTKIGNIFSLNNNDILTDDKFALGGRWLRGFDNYGAGPRNSRTSYVGGNNIVVTKFDYNYEITKNSDFPIFLNLFNDYGLIWDNKTKPTNSDNNLRASAGFGVKYYSPIGPIGFSWGFPLIDEEYDINRMFLFSIGNLD